MLEPGQELFERYRVERMVARGGMATVYQVRHLSLNSQHALKVLDLSTADIRARLLQEGRIQASLTHPHIVAVTDAIEVDGQPALIMEYVDGPTLADVLENRAPDLDQAIEWFRQILGAVRYAHDRGLVHRDLKPENILMAQLPEGLHPKIADFGIAKVLTDWMAERPGPTTRAGLGMGTPAYMPPEQINNAAGVDHRADVFALGCILYELVCGRRAFAGENLVSVLSAVMTGRYPPPGDLVSGLPPGVIAAIEGALQPDPDARTPSCEAMAALLDAGVRHPAAAPAVAPKKPGSTPVSVPEPPRRGFSKVLLIGLVGLVLLIGLGVVGLFGVVGAGGLGFVVARTAQVPAPPEVAAPSARNVVPDVPEPFEGSVAPEVGPRVPQVAPSTARSTRVEVASWRRSQGVRDGVMRRDAKPGHSLILVQTTLTNLSEEEVDLMFPWKVVDGNEGSWGSDLKCSMSLKGSMDALANLEPGEVRSGELCFEVPDTATGLMLQFTDGLGSDPELRFPL